MGYRFLCDILELMYKPSAKRNELFPLDPTDKDKIKTIQKDFLDFAYRVSISRWALLTELDAVFTLYDDTTSSLSFFDDLKMIHDLSHQQKKPNTSLETIFTKLLGEQKSVLPASLAGIAMTVVLGIGYNENPYLKLGSQEARAILTQSLKLLGYHHAPFIPDRFFHIEGGTINRDMLHLLLLSLWGAIRVKYPHKKDQCGSNLKKANIAIDRLIADRHDSELFSSLRSSDQVSEICKSMAEAMKEDAQNIPFPNGQYLDLETFYRLPRFEPQSRSTEQILQYETPFSLRSLVIGKPGSGKSLLRKAIVRTCLEPPVSRNTAYTAYAEALGLHDRTCIPLVLDCKALPQEDGFGNLDLIEAAVDQLVYLTRSSCYADGLAHWDEFSQQVVEYYRQSARDGALLLIVEDLSNLSRACGDALLRKLSEITKTDYYKLHILVLTQHLFPSQMRHLQLYNQVEIAPTSFVLEEEIRRLVDLGIGSATTEAYLSLINRNRSVNTFVDSLNHLVRLLCHPYQDPFDLDALLWNIIDERITECVRDEISEDDCREFLTSLAVTVAESNNRSNLSRHCAPISCRNIPINIVEKGFQGCPDHTPEQRKAIWQHIMDNTVLIHPKGIGSYTFDNPMFYCSLVADHYIQLIGTSPAPNWLDRFNRLSCEDFSSIIVMLFNRMSQNSYEEAAPIEISNYDILLLLQSIGGYIASQTSPVGLHLCLLALQDLLNNRSLCCRLSQNLQRLLQETYTQNYHRLTKLTDDTSKISQLTDPENFRATLQLTPTAI